MPIAPTTLRVASACLRATRTAHALFLLARLALSLHFFAITPWAPSAIDTFSLPQSAATAHLGVDASCIGAGASLRCSTTSPCAVHTGLNATATRVIACPDRFFVDLSIAIVVCLVTKLVDGCLRCTTTECVVRTRLNPWAMLIATRTGVTIGAIVTRFVDHIVAVIVFLIAADLWMHPWGVAETPLISGADLASNAAFRHALACCAIAATLTLLVGLHVTVIVTAIATDFGHRLWTGAPNAPTTDLSTTAAVVAGSLLALRTLIGKTLTIDTAPVWTVGVEAATVVDHLADTVDETLTGRADSSIGENHNAAAIYTAFVAVTVARESARFCFFCIASGAAESDTDDKKREENVDYFFHIPFSCPKKWLQRK